MQEWDDIALLREYVNRNSEEAFATLVTRHVNKVYSVALRHTRNPHQAEEITQAVFVILAKKARHLGRGVVLSGWLYQTARLAAVTFIRSEIRRAHREEEAQMQTLRNETEPEDWRQIAPLLDTAMAGLNEKDRHAVVLRYFDGRSLREVGAALGGSEDAAKMRVNRAVEKLRQFFVKRGIASTAEGIAGTIAANSVQAAPVALAKSITVAAMAKGVAAGGSLPALVKGVLKLMAWHNAKAAVITGAAIVLAAGTTPLLVNAVSSARVDAHPDITGAWEYGDLMVVSRLTTAASLPVQTVLKVSKTNGAYHATLDFPELGQRDVPVASFEYKNGIMRLRLYRLGRYEGTVDPTGSEIQGAVQPVNGPTPPTNRYAIVWKRTAQPPVPPPPLAGSDYAPTGNSILQGVWEGYASIKGIPLRVNLKISESAPGVFRAEIDSLDTGLMHVPATVTYDPPTVGLTCLGAELKGTMNSSNTEFRETSSASLPGITWTFKRGNQGPPGDYSYTKETDLPGHWKGMLKAEDDRLQMFLDIARLPDGKLSATLRGPYQGLNGVSLATVVRYNAPAVRIEWVWSGCSFDGKLEHGKLSGVWNDGGEPTRLDFERSDLK